jgi:hypothetical protein
MPVQRLGPPAPTAADQSLLRDLIAELQRPKDFGQPYVIVQTFESGLRQVEVIWDRWNSCPRERRSAVIHEAFKAVDGPEFERTIGVAVGVTVPEAVYLGLLPFRIRLELNAIDGSTIEQCHEAMRAEGASVLDNPNRPVLRFRTRAEAEACLERLQNRLPGKQWLLLKEPTEDDLFDE